MVKQVRASGFSNIWPRNMGMCQNKKKKQTMQLLHKFSMLHRIELLNQRQLLEVVQPWVLSCRMWTIWSVLGLRESNIHDIRNNKAIPLANHLGMHSIVPNRGIRGIRNKPQIGDGFFCYTQMIQSSLPVRRPEPIGSPAPFVSLFFMKISWVLNGSQKISI